MTAHDPNPDIQPETGEALVSALLAEIGVVERLASARLERGLPNGMSMARFSLLDHLVRLGGAWSPVTLARRFRLTKSAVTNTMGRLAGDGLVAVADDPADRRAKLVSVTQAGRDMRGRCLDGLGSRLAGLASAAPEEDWRAMLAFLRRLRRRLDELA